ncbi:MAG: hypothetical protein Q9163_000564 [Psora crenata]
MRFSKGALELIAIILLSSPHMPRAAPATDPLALKVRGDSPPPPEPKDDGFPKGDAMDLISWTDDDFDNEDFMNAPDCDQDQDVDQDKKKARESDKVFKDPDSHKSIGLKGNFGKEKQLGMIETTVEFEFPKPKPKGYRQWQADHVQDLGFYTTIAKQDVPDGIDATDWQIIKDAILGEQDACPPSVQTKV